MKRLLLSVMALVVAMAMATAIEKPRLIVNVVVSHLSLSDIKPLENNLTSGGFKQLLNQGVRYDSAYYPFATTSQSATATISTGTTPAMHGIVGPEWWNFTTGAKVGAVEDGKSSTYNADHKGSRVSNAGLVMPSIGDALREQNPQSKSVAVAADASSAIILGGMNPTEVWWIDSLGARWTTSTKYVAQLPRWVKQHNSEGWWRKSLARPWVLTKSLNHYANSTTIEAKEKGYIYTKEEEKAKLRSKDLKKVSTSYVANDMVAAFVREAVIYNSLGADEHTDVLNICFDTTARVAAHYGTDSREWEDMIFRLDSTLAELINFVGAQCNGKVVWVLSSDGGCRTTNPQIAKEFNTEQFVFLLGSYMHANYGSGDWILGYSNRGVWLNRELIRANGLQLESIQQALAQFALQYGGVSHVAIQSNMVDGGAKTGVMEVIQEGFYPKRSPDLMMVLMPGWYERHGEEATIGKTVAGTVYDHDRKAILALSGCGIKPQQILRKVDMSSVATTLAVIMDIENPIGATAEPLVEVFQ